MTAKFLINQYYGDGPNRSYWVGCSTGGRQGMVMSQNFPSFFDGIVAGDPVYDQEAIGLSETMAWRRSWTPILSNPAANASRPHDDSASSAAAAWTASVSGIPDLAIRRYLRRRCCKLAMRWTGSRTASSTTCRHAGRGSTRPAPRIPIMPARSDRPARSIPCNVPGRRTQPACRLRKFRPPCRSTRDRGAMASWFMRTAGAVAEDHVNNVAQGYAYDGGWMTTVGIPARKIGTGSPTSLPGDF